MSDTLLSHVETVEPQVEAAVSRFIRRLKYAARFIYWSVRHGSTKHVAWVLAFEGYQWN